MKTITLEIEDEQDISEILALLKSHKVKVKEEKNKSIADKLALFEKSKGTINVPWTITEDALRRENLYDDAEL
jgi:hypothetical protein